MRQLFIANREVFQRYFYPEKVWPSGTDLTIPNTNLNYQAEFVRLFVANSATLLYLFIRILVDILTREEQICPWCVDINFFLHLI